MKKTIFGKESATTSTQLPTTPDNEPQVPSLDDSISRSDMDVNDVDGLG